MSLDTYKADFTDIYTAPDPRAYYATLGPLDYQIPQNALPWLELLLARLDEPDGPEGETTVLDVCCSYGINALLLNHDVALPEVHCRYEEMGDLAPAEVIDADRSDFARLRRRDGLRILGLDASAPAIDYARRSGLHDDGWAEDLESDDPSPAMTDALRDLRLVVCTGGLGYVGVPTLTRILDAVDDPSRVWLALFALRQYDMDPIGEAMASYDLELDRVPAASVRQRRFASEAEASEAVRDLDARGLDPAGREATGWFYADLYVAHPAGERVLA